MKRDDRIHSALSSLRLGASIASLAAESERRERYIRVVRASTLMTFTLVIGTYGFDVLTDQQYSWVECLYMTVVTVSTVGFQEVIPIDSDGLRLFTMVMILFGGGAILYFLTSVAAVIVEGDLAYRFWKTRLLGRLDRQRGHVIVVGLGFTGQQALRHLREAGTQVVVVEAELERIEAVIPEFGEHLLFVVGDAFDGAVLTTAGIERARGLVACLPEDRDNLLVCVTARELNPAVRMVSKGDHVAAEKFQRVGVDAVVEPARMGGRRLANVLRRPGTVALMDAMLDSTAHRLGLAEVRIAEACPEVGRTLSQARLAERSGCVILGLRNTDEGPYRFEPADDSPLTATGTVMALGDRRQLRALRRLLGGPGRATRLRRALADRLSGDTADAGGAAGG